VEVSNGVRGDKAVERNKNERKEEGFYVLGKTRVVATTTTQPS
jgi:hypothetical protein